mgnify:CR=1 FL=1
MTDGIKVMARNRKASFDYHLEQRYEAGVVLTGAEIKSIRANKITLQDGFVEVRNGELWMLNVHINPYEQAGRLGYVEPTRPRKLLLHKKQIAEITDWITGRGNSCVPTMIYLSGGRAKFEIALAKGKKQYDKRESIAKRDVERDIRQALKERVRDN